MSKSFWKISVPIILIALVVVSLFSGVTTPPLKAAPAATPAAPINQPQVINKIAKDTDIVSVVITLKNRYGLESNASQTQRTQRRNNIKAQQNAFVGRQNRRLTKTQSFEVMPVIVAQVKRSDIMTLKGDTDVQSVTLNVPVPPVMYESIQLTGANTAHSAGYTGNGVTVAVLDTGVLKSHPFMANKVVSEACFSSNDSYYGSTSLCPGGATAATTVNSAEPCPEALAGCSHGTHVAGIIAGNRVSIAGQAASGIAPDAKIVSIQVFSRFPASVCGGTSDCVLSFTSDQIAALDWLYRNYSAGAWQNLASANMSLGGGKSTTSCDSDGTKFYIDQLRSVGVATVIASGNSSFSDGISSPACISSAIAVGASTLAKYGMTPDQVASFSNAPLPANNQANAQGDYLLDLLAPGYWVVSAVAYPANTYAAYAGTSMAAPQVAGGWALLKQYAPSASVAQVLDWMRAGGTTIIDSRNGLAVPRMAVDGALRVGGG
jgi:subtilisin family serine protease